MSRDYETISRRLTAALCGMVLGIACGRAALADAVPAGAVDLHASSSAATADVSPESIVPAGMDFMLDVNIRTFFDAPELKPLRDAVLPAGYQRVVDQVYIVSGVDLSRDVDRAVVAGKFGAENKGDVAIILAGRWKEGGVVDLLMNSPQYDSIPVGGQIVHQFWSQRDSDLRYVSFLGSNLAVVGRLKTVETVIAAYEHRGDTMLGDEALASLAGTAAPSFASIVAQGVPEALAAAGRGRIIPNLRGEALRIDAGPELQIRLTAALADPQSAKLALQAVQGLQAAVQLQARRPELADAASRIQCSLDGDRQVQAGAKLPMEDALRLLAAVRHNK